MAQWSNLQDRVKGKWQAPLFIVSIILLAGSFLGIQPDPREFSLPGALEYLDELLAGGLYDQVAEVGDGLLAQEERTDAERAPIHLRLARARHRAAEGGGVATAHAGKQITEHYGRATSHGVPLDAADFRRIGSALEWQRQIGAALEYYQRAIDRGIEGKTELRQHMIRVVQRQPDPTPEQVDGMLDTLLAELEDHRLDVRLWAIEEKLVTLEQLGRGDQASTLLVRNRNRFRGSDQGNHFEYLEALLLFKRGDYGEAEAYLRSVRNRLEREDPVYAMTGWLLGRVVLNDGGPQRPLEALSFFRDVLGYHPDGSYAVASRLGAAEALALLERHQEAIEAYHIAIDALESVRLRRLVNGDVLRASLSVMSEGQRLAGNLTAALGYAELAGTLVDRRDVEQATVFLQRLARIQSLRAEELERRAGEQEAKDPEADIRQSREVYASAAETYLDLARISIVNERAAAEASWRSAELFARAGQLERAAAAYEAYATERPASPMVPRAILRIGQLNQRMGRLAEAIDAYQDCYRRFPRTLDGARALVPLAKCYLSTGPEYDELAEKTLHIVLDDSELFTPLAPEFATALFLLGDVLNRRGSPELAIATLEEALDRYPDDPRAWRARFLLANSFRRSALALRREMSEASYDGELRQMREASDGRLGRARELFRLLIDEYATRNRGSLNTLERLYIEYSSLYEADCYFETQDYRQALKRYEEAAATFKDSPRGLAAYVQIINCHVFLGQPREARAALARAMILVDAIPQPVLDKSVSPETRDDWKQYFDWLAESQLF